MVHNSFKSPDSINTIDWSRRDTHADVYNYYRDLMNLRSQELAFSLNDAQKVREYVSFLPSSETMVAFRINGKNPIEEGEFDYIIAVNLGNKSEELQLPHQEYRLIMGLGVDALGNPINSNDIQSSEYDGCVPQRFMLPPKSSVILRPYSIERMGN